MLAAGDNSCTVPAIPADGVAFRSLKYATDKAADDADTADVDESYDNTGIGRTQVITSKSSKWVSSLGQPRCH